MRLVRHGVHADLPGCWAPRCAFCARAPAPPTGGVRRLRRRPGRVRRPRWWRTGGDARPVVRPTLARAVPGPGSSTRPGHGPGPGDGGGRPARPAGQREQGGAHGVPGATTPADVAVVLRGHERLAAPGVAALATTSGQPHRLNRTLDVLHGRDLVEQAKGLLMARHGTDSSTAWTSWPRSTRPQVRRWKHSRPG
ncbi:ANTAR domain-containing protein [Actinokineospora sp. NBRC 105648]|uniref:ANTAR domain-containing protein n=1 Tax=Actinokineospora sp. NBRC 105648 TaxID=3032206 RepID=UPI00332FB7E2